MKKLIIALLALVLTTSTFASNSRFLDGQFITNGANTLTIPAATDTLVGKETSDTLKNKSMSGADNTFTLIPVGAIGNGSVLSGSNTGDVTLGTASGLSLSGQILSLQLSSTSLTGALSSTDWNTFNNKLSSALVDTHIFVGNGSNIATDVAMSGDITITNVGSTAIGASKVTVSKLNSGAATAGYVATANGSGGVSYDPIPSVAPVITGSVGTPQGVTTSGITFSGSNYTNYWFIQGDPGAVTVTNNPQVSAGSLVGQYLELQGQHSTFTVTFSDGSGLSLNGAWVGAKDSAIDLVWNGSVWVEISRR